MEQLDDLKRDIHKIARDKGFWDMPMGKDCKNCPHWKASKIALMHSELSEALEVIRKPEASKESVGTELADTIIRILDYCAANDIDISQDIINKVQVNAGRDYKHGKRF